MRVFTPAQARTAGEERISKDALRAKSLAETTQELLKTRDEADRSFEEALKRQQKLAEQLHEENVAKKNALKREVEELEQRKKDALSPLVIKQKDIHSKEEALRAWELALRVKEADNEEESRVLMRRLDEVSMAAQTLDVREVAIKRMEQGTHAQRAQVAESAKRLNIQLAEFQKHVEDKETEFAFRQSELDAKSNLIEEIKKGFIDREQEIENAKIQLADQRYTLTKGFEELRKKEALYG